MRAKQQKDERERLARRYVWWQEPGAALGDVPRLLCQIMAFGTARDYVAARREWGRSRLQGRASHRPARRPGREVVGVLASPIRPAGMRLAETAIR